MRKIFYILLSLFIISPVFAQKQDNKDLWAVYTINKQSKNKVQQVRFSSLVGKDDRVELTGQVRDWRTAVVVLVTTTSENGRGICSGSMVGPHTVLTAAHCLVDDYGKFMKEVQVFATGMPEKELYVDENEPYKQANNEQAITKLKSKVSQNIPNIDGLQSEIDTILPVQKNGFVLNIKVRDTDASANAVKLWVPHEYLEKLNGSSFSYDSVPFDYALITLDKSIGDETGWLSLAVKSDKKLQNMKVCVIGRGYDKQVLSLWEGCGKIGYIYEDFFEHDADMLGGNSGGPIFDTEDPGKIIALSNFSTIQKYWPDGHFPNGGMRITPRILNAIKTQIAHES